MQANNGVTIQAFEDLIAARNVRLAGGDDYTQADAYVRIKDNRVVLRNGRLVLEAPDSGWVSRPPENKRENNTVRQCLMRALLTRFDVRCRSLLPDSVKRALKAMDNFIKKGDMGHWDANFEGDRVDSGRPLTFRRICAVVRAVNMLANNDEQNVIAVPGGEQPQAQPVVIGEENPQDALRNDGGGNEQVNEDRNERVNPQVNSQVNEGRHEPVDEPVDEERNERVNERVNEQMNKGNTQPNVKINGSGAAGPQDSAKLVDGAGSGQGQESSLEGTGNLIREEPVREEPIREETIREEPIRNKVSIPQDVKAAWSFLEGDAVVRESGLGKLLDKINKDSLNAAYESFVKAVGEAAENDGLQKILERVPHDMLEEELFGKGSDYTMTVREMLTLIFYRRNTYLPQWKDVIESRLNKDGNVRDLRYPAILLLAEKSVHADNSFKGDVDRYIEARLSESIRKNVPEKKRTNIPQKYGNQKQLDKIREHFCGLTTYRKSALTLDAIFERICRETLACEALREGFKDNTRTVYGVIENELDNAWAPCGMELPKDSGVPDAPGGNGLGRPEAGNAKLEIENLKMRVGQLDATFKSLKERWIEQKDELGGDSATLSQSKIYLLGELLFSKSLDEARESMAKHADALIFEYERLVEIKRQFGGSDSVAAMLETQFEALLTKLREGVEKLEAAGTALGKWVRTPVPKEAEPSLLSLMAIAREYGDDSYKKMVDALGAKTDKALSEIFEITSAAAWQYDENDESGLSVLDNDFATDGALKSGLSHLEKLRETECMKKCLRDFISSDVWVNSGLFTENDVASIRAGAGSLKLSNHCDLKENAVPSLNPLMKGLRDDWEKVPCGERKRAVFEYLFAQYALSRFAGFAYERILPFSFRKSDMRENEKFLVRKIYSECGRLLSEDPELEDVKQSSIWLAVQEKGAGNDEGGGAIRASCAGSFRRRVERAFCQGHLVDAEDAAALKTYQPVTAPRLKEWKNTTPATAPKLEDLKFFASALLIEPDALHFPQGKHLPSCIIVKYARWVKPAARWLLGKRVEQEWLAKYKNLDPLPAEGSCRLDLEKVSYGEDGERNINSTKLLKELGLDEEEAYLVAVALNNAIRFSSDDKSHAQESYSLKVLKESFLKGFDAGFDDYLHAVQIVNTPANKRLEANFPGQVQGIFDKIQKQVTDYFKPKFPQVPKDSAIAENTLGKTRAGNVTLNALLDKSGAVNLDAEFMRRVLDVYYKTIPVAERHLLLSMKIRNRVPSPGVLNDNEARKRESFAALLKSSGPVMVKMLQGLDAEAFADKDMKTILGDLKHELYAIPEVQREAFLCAAVAKWNTTVPEGQKKIVGIRVVQSLGAASVGETLLCEVKYEGETAPVACAVKVLRPEARLRAHREYDLFLSVARKMDAELGTNMYATYRGKLDAILEELDLQNELEFVKAGRKAYETDDSVKDLKCGNHDHVKSEEPADGARSARNVMLLKKADGLTVAKQLSVWKENLAHLKQEPRNAEGLKKLRDKARRCHTALEELARLWFARAAFSPSGFYHGDLHAGNVMIGENGTLTLIDYGNAKTLSPVEAKAFVHIVAGAAAGISDRNKGFLWGFAQLFPAGPEREAFEAKADSTEVRKAIAKILSLENGQACGRRLQAILQMFKERGIVLPAAIYNFNESQIRLANMLEDSKNFLAEVDGALSDAGVKSPQEDPVKDLFSCVADVVGENAETAIDLLGGGIVAAQFMNGFEANGLMTKTQMLAAYWRQLGPVVNEISAKGKELSAKADEFTRKAGAFLSEAGRWLSDRMRSVSEKGSQGASSGHP